MTETLWLNFDSKKVEICYCLEYISTTVYVHNTMQQENRSIMNTWWFSNNFFNIEDLPKTIKVDGQFVN